MNNKKKGKNVKFWEKSNERMIAKKATLNKIREKQIKDMVNKIENYLLTLSPAGVLCLSGY